MSPGLLPAAAAAAAAGLRLKYCPGKMWAPGGKPAMKFVMPAGTVSGMYDIAMGPPALACTVVAKDIV